MVKENNKISNAITTINEMLSEYDSLSYNCACNQSNQDMISVNKDSLEYNLKMIHKSLELVEKLLRDETEDVSQIRWQKLWKNSLEMIQVLQEENLELIEERNTRDKIVTLDPETYAMYIYLKDKEIIKTENLDDNVLVDLSLDGSIVGIEILDTVDAYSEAFHKENRIKKE